MSKKRAIRICALQAEFWTALSIDECQARIIELEHRSAVSWSHPSLANITSDYITFRLAHNHRLTPWQSGQWSPGMKRETIQFTLDGSLQTTADGTHVLLEMAPSTRLRLWLEAARAGCGIPFFAMWTIVFASVTLEHFFSRDNPILAILHGEVCKGALAFIFLLGFPSIWGAIAISYFSRYWNISTTARTLIASVRDELYAGTPPSTQND